MKSMNTMQIAWMVYRNFGGRVSFSYALRTAWKMWKQAKVTVEGNNVVIVSDTLSQYSFATPLKRQGKKLVVSNDPSDFKSIVTEISYIG